MLFKGLGAEVICGVYPSKRHPLDAFQWSISLFFKDQIIHLIIRKPKSF
jgi:hypothetical protein